MTKSNMKSLNNKPVGEVNQIKASNLLELAKHHKQHCDGNCEISLYLLLEDFEKYVGRKATDEEVENFL